MTRDQAMALAGAKRAEAASIRRAMSVTSPARAAIERATAALLEAEAARLESNWMSAGEAVEAVMLRIGMGM